MTSVLNPLVVGEAFAGAVAAKDRAALLGLLAPDVEFRGLTPGRSWTADDAVTAVDEIVLGSWFTVTDDIQALEAVETAEVGDRLRVGYRMRIRAEGEVTVCEQQAYYMLADDRINWLRVLCSGFRPYRSPA